MRRGLAKEHAPVRFYSVCRRSMSAFILLFTEMQRTIVINSSIWFHLVPSGSIWFHVPVRLLGRERRPRCCLHAAENVTERPKVGHL
jgi:hypothetical protein